MGCKGSKLVLSINQTYKICYLAPVQNNLICTFASMNSIRITAVSYYNTLPFIYGLKHSMLLSGFSLSLDVPSECARKLKEDEADIALIPVGALPGLPYYEIIGDLCIGADKDVKSVLLLSNSDINQIRTIYLDTDSRTSVNLVKILASKFWNIEPSWKSIADKPEKMAETDGMVLIGDKTFGLNTQYEYCFDLAGEWIKFTQLPFVFAVWVANKSISDEFKSSFTAALNWGVEHKDESVVMAEKLHISKEALLSYLHNDISYPLNMKKKEGMNLFLKLLSDL